MTDYHAVERQLVDALGLQRRPVAVAFRPSPPAGVPRFSGTEPSGCSFWRLAGGWQVGRFGSCWLMQTATLNVQEPLPHSPSVSQGSPSVQETTLPPRTSGPGLSMPRTFNST